MVGYLIGLITEREAMWIYFQTEGGKRWAIRPFVGGVNGISGEVATGDMRTFLRQSQSASLRQDYLVLPEQLWLDGIATSPGIVKQFVATPMLSAAQQEKIKKKTSQGPLERERRRSSRAQAAPMP